MTKFLSILVLAMLFTAIYANQEAQDLCVSEFTSQCQAKCQQAEAVDCADRCQDDAKNQCRQAGE